jgi:hypothetical protein
MFALYVHANALFKGKVIVPAGDARAFVRTQAEFSSFVKRPLVSTYATAAFLEVGPVAGVVGTETSRNARHFLSVQKQSFKKN